MKPPFRSSLGSRTLLSTATAAVGLVMMAQQAQAALWTLGFVSTGAAISFDGTGGFEFLPPGIPSSFNNSFQIVSEAGGASPLTDRSFGTITAPAGGFLLAGGSTGRLAIESAFDSSILTASLSFGAATINGIGTTGALNDSLALNITSISYAGADPSLTDLYSAGSAVLILDWTFNTTGHTLANLSTVAQSTTFSGNIGLSSPIVPEASTWVTGLLMVLPFGIQGIRWLRNRKAAA